MAKIGRSIRMKQEDKGPYYVLGIAVTHDGFELRKLKMHGDEVMHVETVATSTDRAEIISQLEINTVYYAYDFNQQQSK
jgi:hypothetical protein